MVSMKLGDSLFSGNGAMDTKDNRKNMYVVMRHADRSDCAWDASLEWLNSAEFEQCAGDPPLSVQGIQRAKSFGESLRCGISTKGFEKIVVISSPYLRCVQTAAEICRCFDGSSMYIDYQLGERWHPEVVGEKPALQPCLQARNWCEEQGITLRGDPLGSWPQWPEEKNEAQNRYAIRFLQYTQLGQRKGFAFILVTHGEGVSSMLQTLPEYQGTRIEAIGYCGGFRASCTSHVQTSASIHEVWRVKTQGISFDSNFKSKEYLDESPYQTDHKECGLDFPPTDKARTIHIISEAVSSGNLLLSGKNILHEKDFFSSHEETFHGVVTHGTSFFDFCSPKHAGRKRARFKTCPALGEVPHKQTQIQKEKSNLLVRWLRWLQATNEIQKLFPRHLWSKRATMAPTITMKGSKILQRRRKLGNSSLRGDTL
eukprot:gnl/MRDRNA2_/MRDRNA2_34006_c0_seq1.p1 gnl/MRDRNA2_/MRDRNA2_34006_c0~~gnl/MRDRNA2_/MRDRNA2_34006_c0_seq1.p1  ORF type:complete len:427 (-),score=55.90 gnl/MRDRNA2_/MRDRNA2_34006_c0_seq1:446-1726(-)